MKRALPLMSLLATGCSFTTMTPAHRLEAGEVVVQGAIDEPGALFIPRLSGQLSIGTGKADLGVHLGTTALTFNAGATARAYLGEWALSLQADGVITTFEESLFSAPRRFGFLTLTPRFGRLLRPDDRFYYGFQALGILPFNISETADLPSRPGFAAGVYIGYAWDSPGNVDLQVEISTAPLGVFPGIFTEVETRYSVGVVPIVQLGFGVQYRRETNRPPPSLPMEPVDDRIL